MILCDKMLLECVDNVFYSSLSVGALAHPVSYVNAVPTSYSKLCAVLPSSSTYEDSVLSGHILPPDKSLLAHLWASIVRDSARNLGVTVCKRTLLCISQLTCLWASKLRDSAASLGVTVRMQHSSPCFWVAETCNSHATLGVMVRKRDISFCP